MRLERPSPTTQEILDSGAIPRLRGYIVRPGKVSDSVFGGEGSYVDKATKRRVDFENPPLEDGNGLPVRIMVRTDRISTHDINRGNIPFKGQILASNHNFMRRLLIAELGTSQLDIPGLEDSAAVTVAENLTQIPLEMVLRAYMAKTNTETSLYVHYMRGERTFCGHALPEGLIANGKLPDIIDTPTTKSDEHDELILPADIAKLGICTLAQYEVVKRHATDAFRKVAKALLERGLIAVDTKTEHGINSRNQIVVQDEVWTMDSSRFWLLKDYTEQMTKLRSGEITELELKALSKEYARKFSKGEEGYSDEERALIAVRYVDGIEQLLGRPFVPDMRPWEERVVSGLEKAVETLS
ncbi:MAG TPA: phosphoribosylaminoimidazolesuccinocarboxamide synthase [Candidatus Nanoarchaeia archaeon]|nr:phosphoribosylaminoimidazolesuccinocarboxamide synthase [Candidatus Nanoarchaeia archaeon]